MATAPGLFCDSIAAPGLFCDGITAPGLPAGVRDMVAAPGFPAGVCNGTAMDLSSRQSRRGGLKLILLLGVRLPAPPRRVCGGHMLSILI